MWASPHFFPITRDACGRPERLYALHPEPSRLYEKEGGLAPPGAAPPITGGQQPGPRSRCGCSCIQMLLAEDSPWRHVSHENPPAGQTELGWGTLLSLLRAQQTCKTESNAGAGGTGGLLRAEADPAARDGGEEGPPVSPANRRVQPHLASFSKPLLLCFPIRSRQDPCSHPC